MTTAGSDEQLKALKQSAKKLVPKSAAANTPVEDDENTLDVQKLIIIAAAQNVSDIHLRVDSAPIFRVMGDMMPTKFPVITPEIMRQIASWLIPERLIPKLKNNKDFDFAITWHNQRMRVNLLYELGRPAFVIRLIHSRVPLLESLDMPRVVRAFTELSSGLIIVAGPAGSGKSTTLASLIHEINRNHRRHIITLEDPVEFIHQPMKSIVTQRQVEVDTPDFATGIRQALRQTPDVLLIGEMRDRDTVLSAIKAAETGALVLTTLHTPDAVQTINRLVHMFDPSEYESIRGHLAQILKGIIAQRLYKLESGEGRAAVVEVVSVNTTVKDYILKNDMETLYKLVDQSRLEDMQSLNGALYQLYINKQISIEEALRQSNNPIALQNRFQGVFHGTANYEFEDF